MYSEARAWLAKLMSITTRGVAVGGGQVDQAALAQEVDLAAVFQHVFVDEGAGWLCWTLASFSSAGEVEFDVEVAGVADHGAVLHLGEVLLRDDGLLPVTVMKMSPILAASAIGMTWKPSIAASRARDRDRSR